MIVSVNLLDEFSGKAVSSFRYRTNFNIHKSYDEPCQKLLNFIGLDSYIRPHRHSLDHNEEYLMAVRGLFALIIFDNGGEISKVHFLGTEKYYDRNNNVDVGIQVDPDMWHTVLSLVPNSILFEVKAGPFNPVSAKEYAEWAPEEGSLESVTYLNDLRKFVFSCLELDFDAGS